MTTEKNRVLLKKKMHSAERYQNWIYIPSKLREFFPYGTVVLVRIKGKEVLMKINKHGYMSPQTILWATFADLLNFDKEHDTLVFMRHEDGTLEIDCEKMGMKNYSTRKW